MKLINLLQINISKLNQHKLKAMFLILPITILMILTIVVTSQVQNFQKASDTAIFGTIQNQSTLINLTKTVDFTGGNPGQFFNSDNQYTTDDLTKIKAISNVKDASINAIVPTSNLQTTNLFSGSTFTLSNVAELDSDSASLYTDEDFLYTEGTTTEIPIILNANTFQTQYEDWGGKTSIAVTFTRPSGRPTGTPGDPFANSGAPVKTKKLDYTKSDLLGKTFTLTAGGLKSIQDYTTTQASGTVTYTKLTDAEIATKLAEQTAAISKYWDYTKISTPISYTFKVVGIIETQGSNKTYIPSTFASKLVKDTVQNQLSARNSTAITTTLLNSTYRGMTYDGTELSSGSDRSGFGGRNFGGMGGGQRPGEASTATTSYTIPGLIIQLSTDGKQTVEGEYKDATVYDQAVKKGDSISIKINSVYDRTQVVKDLNTAGFTYQDLDNLDVFTSLKSTLATISFWFTIAFIIFGASVIIFAMSKFVSDSRKEIGIFRAIGMKKSSIVVLFTSQAILYSAIGFVIGSAIGFALNILSSSAMKSWFDSLVSSTVKDTFNVVNPVDANIFSNFDWTTIGYYSLGLLIITFLISLIPAFRASSVSPVEAIKGE